MAQEHPKALIDIQNAVLDFKFARAKEIAEGIGLEEYRVISQGGVDGAPLTAA